MDERTAWVVLASVEGVGGATFGALVARHGGASAVLEAARDGGLTGPSRARRGGRIATLDVPAERVAAAARDPGAILRRLEHLGVWTATPLDAAYPGRFSVLDPRPPVLYGWGDPAALSAPRSAAVVGTRRPSPGGRMLAARIAGRLVEHGATVVSGLAIGIDGAAHAAVVERGGQTVAVIGGGHAHAGPRAHRRLLDAITSSGGAVVSELPPDVTPTKGTFPRRNRLISALGDATIVVEAPPRSGALITARHALEQGRPLFVVPGRPGDPAVAGCLALLRETPARPVVGLDELVADLAFDGSPTLARSAVALGRGAALELLAQPQRAVAMAVARAPSDLDGLVARTGLPPPIVAASITLLLLRGWIQAAGPAYLPAGPLLVE